MVRVESHPGPRQKPINLPAFSSLRINTPSDRDYWERRTCRNPVTLLPTATRHVLPSFSPTQFSVPTGMQSMRLTTRQNDCIYKSRTGHVFHALLSRFGWCLTKPVPTVLQMPLLMMHFFISSIPVHPNGTEPREKKYAEDLAWCLSDLWRKPGRRAHALFCY